MKKGILLTGVFLAFSVQLTGSAGTWYVDGSVAQSGDGKSWATAFRTIQEGIDAAAALDTVIVAQGTYKRIAFKGKDIILRSTDPLDSNVVESTIIDGARAGAVVSLSGAETEVCVIEGFTIQNGKGGYGGGIVGRGSLANSVATIRNNVITGNWGEYGGGVAYCDGTIENNKIFSNAGWAGGLYSCNGVIQNNIISDNTANYPGWASDGGGLQGCNGTIQNNEISGNIAQHNGGGLANCDGIVQNNIIVENTAALEGGGLCSCDGPVRNNRIAANGAKNGGGLSGGAATMRNNTIAQNWAQQSGGGMSAFTGTTRNCIIWGNTAPTGAQLSNSATPTYSCIQDWTAGGEGNIADNPHLQEDVLHLKADSACIDAGKNEYWMWQATDLDGEPRIMQGRSSLTVDMGADEYSGVGPPDVTYFAINNEAATTPDLAVTLNNTTENGPTEYMASEDPSFTAATWLPYSTAPQFTLSQGDGEKTVYFKAKNDAGESNVVSDSIIVAPDSFKAERKYPNGTLASVFYPPGGVYEMPIRFEYPGTLMALAVQDNPPSGWTFESVGGPNPPYLMPTLGQGGPFSFVWVTPPNSPVCFTYTVRVPAGTQQVSEFSGGKVLYRGTGGEMECVIVPDPFRVWPNLYHDLDYWPPTGSPSCAGRVGDWVINLHELLRVIQLYNCGGYHRDPNGEDCFGCGPLAKSTPLGVADETAPEEDAVCAERLLPHGYTPGSDIPVEVAITYTGTLMAIGIEETIPDGWTFVSADDVPITPPQGAKGSLGFAWITPPDSPIILSYTVHVPEEEIGPKAFSGSVLYRRTGGEETAAIPVSLVHFPVVNITSPGPTGEGKVALDWDPFGTGYYAVFYTDDLSSDIWWPVPGPSWPIAETSSEDTVTPGVTRRFYKVMAQ